MLGLLGVGLSMVGFSVVGFVLLLCLISDIYIYAYVKSSEFWTFIVGRSICAFGCLQICIVDDCHPKDVGTLLITRRDSKRPLARADWYAIVVQRTWETLLLVQYSMPSNAPPSEIDLPKWIALNDSLFVFVKRVSTTIANKT